MKVFVAGASGFIAREIIQALLQHGHEVIACARNIRQLKEILPAVQRVHCNFASEDDIQALHIPMHQADVLINCIGVFRTRRKKTIWQIQDSNARLLFNTAIQGSIKKIIHLSALGIDNVNIDYATSKLSADNYLQTLPCDSVIIRPSLVYGPGSYGGSSLLRGLAGLPYFLPIPGQGDRQLQPIHVHDLAEITARALKLTGHHIINAVGAETICLKDILISIRRWLGFGKAILLNIPLKLIKWVSVLGDLIQSVAINNTGYVMLSQDNIGTLNDYQKIQELLAIQPRGFQEGLNRMVSCVQDRWHARLYFLKPLLRLSLGFMWLFTGLCSWFWYPQSDSFALLHQAGIPAGFELPLLATASIIDVVLGILTLINFQIRRIGSIQFLLIIVYSVIISLKLPEYWLHPFAPLVKNIPILATILVMIATESDR